MSNKFFSLILATLLLSGCANEPETITLTPSLVNKPMVIYQEQAAELKVTDGRAKDHVVQLMNADDPYTFISASNPISSVLEQKFTQEMNDQGLNLVDASDLKIEFVIKRARTFVNQDVLDYRANTIIKVLAKVENPEQTLTKTFTLRATSRGPLKADLEEIQTGFNQQLSKLILQVLEDEQLQQFIKG